MPYRPINVAGWLAYERRATEFNQQHRFSALPPRGVWGGAVVALYVLYYVEHLTLSLKTVLEKNRERRAIYDQKYFQKATQNVSIALIVIEESSC
jgi:hypothetical protein